jgi:assimilatory nitrate reductase catalytic subunit
MFIPILPGTDVALFNAMLHRADLGRPDRYAVHRRSHSDFGALKTAVRDCTPAWAAAICGIAEQQIVTAARWFGESKAALSLYCQGLNQSSAGTGEERGADPPASGDRPDRQAGRRPVLS